MSWLTKKPLPLWWIFWAIAILIFTGFAIGYPTGKRVADRWWQAHQMKCEPTSNSVGDSLKGIPIKPWSTIPLPAKRCKAGENPWGNNCFYVQRGISK